MSRIQEVYTNTMIYDAPALKVRAPSCAKHRYREIRLGVHDTLTLHLVFRSREQLMTWIEGALVALAEHEP